MSDLVPPAPYLLLTPGPASTSPTVKAAMLRDWCTWDRDYHDLVQQLRADLVALASDSAEVTAVLLQGSGTFAVEATVGSVVPPDGKLLVLDNGAYGRRIGEIAARLGIVHQVLRYAETCPVDPADINAALRADPQLSHVALVHCETTTGMLNPAAAVGEVVARHGRCFIVDAMSSFGGLPLSMDGLQADYLIASANKCLQGVPGCAFVLARRGRLAATAGWARSLSLDLWDQWREMEDGHGKWRYTSPTHVVRALAQAVAELQAEGGVTARHARYRANQQRLVAGLAALGVAALLPPELHSPVITAFREPDWPSYTFERFYAALKQRGFVIYPGKVSAAPTFRIGTIGHLFAEDIERLLDALAQTFHDLAA
ncbi:MAG: 2-aminoethylphosphonate--pyruvate transaminase [Fimbriimonadaceae bacterium]|nr:2-aminoethylphosphonate--pyruvate transaminase [Fimbriimonadaceae bacterium]